MNIRRIARSASLLPSRSRMMAILNLTKIDRDVNFEFTCS